MLTLSSYEKLQQTKQVILITLYLARNKGGGQKSRQTLLEYFVELTAKKAANEDEEKNAAGMLQLKIGSLFNPRQFLVLKDMPQLKGLYYSLLKD